MSARIVAAAAQSGIGLTLLPVLYQQGGCDGAPLAASQRRFANTPDSFARLIDRARHHLGALSPDAGLGVAPHSLRAVSPDGLTAAAAMAPELPLHIHVAEQAGEVEEVRAAYGQRPVEWLLDHHRIDARWCLIHCTQMTEDETRRLAGTGAVAGLCPITEANLGDGIFNGQLWQAEGGVFGIGSDSNIRISLAGELRMLEYSQRLRHRQRAVLASRDGSSGRVLYDAAVAGGAQALMRGSGGIAVGNPADLVALDPGAADLDGRTGDAILDSFIFTGGSGMVTDLWSAGRHLVSEGRHLHREGIEAGYRATLRALRERI